MDMKHGKAAWTWSLVAQNAHPAAWKYFFTHKKVLLLQRASVNIIPLMTS
jgi:hypothetical protein